MVLLFREENRFSPKLMRQNGLFEATARGPEAIHFLPVASAASRPAWAGTWLWYGPWVLRCSYKFCRLRTPAHISRPTTALRDLFRLICLFYLQLLAGFGRIILGPD